MQQLYTFFTSELTQDKPSLIKNKLRENELEKKKGSSVKCMNAFRLVLTEKQKLLMKYLSSG